MIIISSRKFRDSQQEYFRKALSEDVILTTVHYGSFRLVPIIEGEPRAGHFSVVTENKPVPEPVQVQKPVALPAAAEAHEPDKQERSNPPEVYVDPALYDQYPEQYARELEEEKKQLEALQARGLKKFFRRGK